MASMDAEGFEKRARESIAFLREIVENRRLLANLDEAERRELLMAAGQVARPGPYAKRELAREVRKRRRQELRAAKEQVLAGTGIRAKRRELVFRTPVFSTPPVSPAYDAPQLPGQNDGSSTQKMHVERTCYICKEPFSELHFFYDQMCPRCADFNYQKRQQTADLAGRVALITGARVKIGYQAAIMLLRAGARVLVTTRFPHDAALRYANEPDCEDWEHRLSIFGLDLRHTPSVEAFAVHLLRTEERLDVLINNACQTVRRPAGFYAHLMQGERREQGALPPRAARFVESNARLREGLVAASPSAKHLGDSAELSQVALTVEDRDIRTCIFPTGKLDQDLQQIDLRERNSWRLQLSEVSSVELLEVQLVNAVAPFILNARLKELMMQVPSNDKHIVNVSAVEGQFYRSFKTDKHPHTNMAKAALNMMTRTSAVDYIKDGIHMNSVDTGWVTDEDPAEIAARKTVVHGFHPPLDIVDGAARIVDPVFHGFNTQEHLWGRFLKDYAPAPW